MIKMTNLSATPAVAQSRRRSAVPASRFGNSGFVVRTRGWLSAGIAPKHGTAAPDSAPHRESLL